MRGKWFTNRGQIIQIGLAALTLVFIAREAIRDFLANQPLTAPTLAFAAALALMVLMIVRFVESRPLQPAHEPSASPHGPTAVATASPAQTTEWTGSPQFTKVTIKKGEYIEMDGNSVKLTLLDIPKARGRLADYSEYVAEVEISGNFFATLFSESRANRRFLLPCMDNPSIRSAAGIASDYIREDGLSYIKIHVEHINAHANEVTFSVMEAKFRKPLV